MLSKLKVLYQKLTKKAIKSILLIVVFPIIALRLLGFLQWAEWTAYDLLFKFSPSESRDERIVLVGWDEQDLQKTKEITMSDQTLGLVINKIKAQKPRVIGLDLYRDIPVHSRTLDQQPNEEAYNQLQEIFRSTPNLLGIEKVLEPTIAPPPVLKEKEQVFTADLITDTDNIVRRSYIANQPLEREGDPTSSQTVLYLGTVLGVDYLAESGFSLEATKDNSMRIFKGQNEIILNNLKTFDGGYINNYYHLDFLVNWRRGNNLFETISVDKLLNGEIPPHLFKDKIVLIGNIASSTADRHFLPTRRWDEIQTWTYGVYIVAHVTSSIISAALDGRPLIKVAPWGSGYLLLLISVASTAYLIFKFSEFRTQKLYFLSALFSLVLTILLSFGSLLAFQFGWWIPIIPAVLGIWLTFLVVNNHVQLTKEQENTLKLELISTDLNHQLGNSSNLINLNLSTIKTGSQTIHQIFVEEHQESEDIGAIEKGTKLEETERGQALTAIDEGIAQINQQMEIIKRYKQRTTQFISVTCSRKEPQKQRTNVNEIVKQIVERVTSEKPQKYDYEIMVEQTYDANLKQAQIDRISLEIILDNLIDNAFWAVQPQPDRKPSYCPTVKIETHKRDNWIEIIVKDNGIGMSQKRQRNIFQPFMSFKTDKGQGIGLTLVKELLKLEEGKIEVESTLGEGSKFTVTLPLKQK